MNPAHPARPRQPNQAVSGKAEESEASPPSAGRRDCESQPRQQGIVFGVGADEEPHNHVAFSLTDRTIIVSDADGSDVLMRGRLLEFQTPMSWISFEELVSTARLLLDPL